MPARGVGAAAGGLALLGLALLAGFTALPRGGPRATVLNSVEAAAQHAAGDVTDPNSYAWHSWTTSGIHKPFSDDPQSFSGISGQAVGYGGARWARSGAGGLAPNEGDGKYLANNVAAEDDFGPRRNPGGGYTGYVQPRMPQDHIGAVNPYTDLPHRGRTERGLPTIERRYRMPGEPKVFTAPGQKPVFASNQALRDLEPLKEFGLLSDKTYKLQKRNIQASLEDPFGSVAREEPPSGFVPEGWTGPTTMCRDVTTKVAGLDNEGWAEMNTMKCCNYLCSRTQWLALKDGELQWGLGPNNRYSSAVHTASTAKMADGSDKYLCRSCAWDREPNWKDYGLNGITKMEGHLCPFNTLTGVASWTQFGDECPEPEGVFSSTKSSDPDMADVSVAHADPMPGGVIE